MSDETGQAWALRSIAFSLLQMGRLEEAGDANARALAAMRASGNKPGVVNSLNVQALIQRARGDVATARESFAQTLAAYKALGDESATAVVLSNLAELEFGEGQVEQALRLVGEAIEINYGGKTRHR